MAVIGVKKVYPTQMASTVFFCPHDCAAVMGSPYFLPNDKKDVPLQAIIGAVRFYVASTGGLTITERLNKET